MYLFWKVLWGFLNIGCHLIVTKVYTILDFVMKHVRDLGRSIQWFKKWSQWYQLEHMPCAGHLTLLILRAKAIIHKSKGKTHLFCCMTFLKTEETLRSSLGEYHPSFSDLESWSGYQTTEGEVTCFCRDVLKWPKATWKNGIPLMTALFDLCDLFPPSNIQNDHIYANNNQGVYHFMNRPNALSWGVIWSSGLSELHVGSTWMDNEWCLCVLVRLG